MGPQTDGICAGFVASYADRDTVYVVGGKFINLQQDPNPKICHQMSLIYLEQLTPIQSRNKPCLPNEKIHYYFYENTPSHFLVT